MKRLLRGAALGAAVLGITALTAPAQAATVVTYTLHASGSGSFVHYRDYNHGPLITDTLQSSTLTFNIPLLDRQNITFGQIDAGTFGISSNPGGIEFGFQTSDEYTPGAVTGMGAACFDNPGGRFPTGDVQLISLRGCGAVSYYKQGKYSYETFSGIIDRISVQVSQGTISANASIVGYVPEPATWAMMLVGFGMMGGALRYRRRSSAVTYA
jgi:hypothetical protein